MFSTLVPLFPGIPGGPEVLIILAIIIILFGANKIPKLAGSIGQAQGEFEKGRIEAQEEIDRMRDMSDPSDISEGETATDSAPDSTGANAGDTESATTETANTGVETETETETANTETANTETDNTA